MKIKNSVSLLIAAFLITGLNSCREEEEATVVTEQEEVDIANESSSHDSVVDVEIEAFSDILAEDEGGRIAAGCANVTRDEQAKTITIDFGSACVGPYGRERSGKIVITYGGSFGDHLANRVITFHNYFVNNKQITGTIELRDINIDGDGNITLTRRHTDLKVTFPDGNHFTSNGSITITWLEGYGDDDPGNDVFQITGAQEGVSTRGRRVTRTIVEPVVVDMNCFSNGGFARVSGEIQISISGVNRERSRTINYGDGSCDNAITVSLDGKVFTVTMS